MSSQLTPAKKKKGKTVLPDRGHRCVHVEDGKLTAIQNPSSPRLMEPITICPRRFIDTHSLQLVEFGQSETIPTYAILSHRWVSAKEVVYDEFIRPSEDTRFKTGYLKIKSSCKRARQDGIRHLWVDTCCIKQGDHADVAANITSMYAYYQNAEVCYAYLVDARGKEDMFGKVKLLQYGSEWFYRGWTLQELIAPRTVIFFNKRWCRIGDKYGLREDLWDRTTIPPSVLAGTKSIQDIDVVTRMSWATDRRTTKRQDEAYCLQGLLGVSVEPDYEEKHRNAFNRLGKALFDAQPELKEKLGVKDDMLNPDSFNFWYLLWARLYETRKKIDNAREERRLSRQTVEPE